MLTADISGPESLLDTALVMISDSMEAAGMPDGEYELGGQKVFKKGKSALLSDGTLAGSVCNLFDCMINAIKAGISFESAIKAATVNPAIALGIFDRVGSIEAGKKADIVIMDDRLDIIEVITQS